MNKQDMEDFFHKIRWNPAQFTWNNIRERYKNIENIRNAFNVNDFIHDIWVSIREASFK